MSNGLINIKPAFMYGDEYQKDEAEKTLTPEEQKLEAVPDIKPEAQKGGNSAAQAPDSKVASLGQPVYAESTKLEKQIEGGGSSKKKKKPAKKVDVRVAEVDDVVHVKALPRSLYNTIDKAIDIPNATVSEKVAAFLYSIIGDEDSRDVSPFVKELAEDYGFDTANELRGLRDAIGLMAQQQDRMMMIMKENNLLHDQELFALSYVIHNRLGFSRQPPTSESEVNFNADGVDTIRSKMQADWKKQREEKKRKDGIRLK